MKLSSAMEKAILLLGDAWFSFNIKSNTRYALEQRRLLRMASLELPSASGPERCYVVGLTVKGMDEYHRLKGWTTEETNGQDED